MTVASMDPSGTAAPRVLRLDAVLALRYRHEFDGVRVHCDPPFLLVGDRIDVPLDMWKDWRRLRLHVVPAGDVPPTVLLVADLHGNPLRGGRGRLVRRLDRLDIDLLPTPAGATFSLVFAGPGNIATIRVSLCLLDELDTLLAPPDAHRSLPPPRVREVRQSWPLTPATPRTSIHSTRSQPTVA